LSPEEETKITDVLRHKYPEYLNVFILALHTGARTSEILRAQVGDFDEPTGMLTIRQQKDIRKPKIRLVPATPKAIDAYKGLAAGKQAGAPLCTNRQGGQLYEYRYWLVPAIELSGVKDFTPKDLRHTAASRWVMSGVPIAAVAKYLGHSTIQMTVMRYSHLTPNVNAQAIAAAMSYYDKKTIPTSAESSHPSAK
jgi:integrase